MHHKSQWSRCGSNGQQTPQTGVIYILYLPSDKKTNFAFVGSCTLLEYFPSSNMPHGGVRRQVPISLQAVVFITRATVIYGVGHGLCILATVLRSTKSIQPSTLYKGKERKSIYRAPFIYYVYLKALRHGSHSFTCKYTMFAFAS